MPDLPGANGDSLVGPKTVPDGNGPDPVVTVQLTHSGPTRTHQWVRPQPRLSPEGEEARQQEGDRAAHELRQERDAERTDTGRALRRAGAVRSPPAGL